MSKRDSRGVEIEPMEGRCTFFIPKKQRFCRLIPRRGQTYCQEHLKVSNGRKRVVCPLDPTHTIFEDRIKKHLRVCPGGAPAERFIVKGVNSGSVDEGDDNTLETTPAPLQAPPRSPITSTGEEAKNVPMKLLISQKQMKKLGQTAPSKAFLDEKKVMDIVSRVKAAVASHSHLIATSPPELPVPSPPPNIPKNVSSDIEAVHPPKKLTAKHLVQHESLINILYNLPLASPASPPSQSPPLAPSLALEEPRPLYCEFGAGKGSLSIDIQQRFDSDHLLIDRSKFRGMADRHAFLRNQDAGKDSSTSVRIPEWSRVKADIADFVLEEHPSASSGRHVFAFGKHLCGAATDFTLRSMLSYRDAIATPPNLDGTKSVEQKPPFSLMIALCCNHRCEWKSYVNKPFFQSLNFTKEDFHIITRLSSWAVSYNPTRSPSDGEDADEEHAPPPTSNISSLSVFSHEEKALIGRACKRLLDIGRVLKLNESGVSVGLYPYVDQNVTMENIALVSVAPSR
eukprot:TRINITY_DN5444_c0_g1_i1.p1 TRINITY_DN5444_c0_g1~~TRINITY_DN5444_c0_g1_i1.p1  ORF type:complete len:511 (-),score=93.74 TRINITY_DN5444_c0_g1_i1:39-1571(-)